MEEQQLQSIRCPYCEQTIIGDALYLMQHGIACRQQWEVRQQQIRNNSSTKQDQK